MALDLEEQEQVAEFKAWWNQYGNLLAFALVAAAVVIGGWQGWRWYQQAQAQEASVVYDTLARAASPSGELPVGAVTALAGAPFFLYLLRRNGGRS